MKNILFSFLPALDLLTSKNYCIKDLVCVTMFISDMSQFAQLNSTYTNVIDEHNAPVRICLQTKLPQNAPILIEAVAHKALSVATTTATTTVTAIGERRCMHVRSISHWAPANIGPYSQSIMVMNVVYL